MNEFGTAANLAQSCTVPVVAGEENRSCEGSRIHLHATRHLTIKDLLHGYCSQAKYTGVSQLPATDVVLKFAYNPAPRTLNSCWMKTGVN